MDLQTDAELAMRLGAKRPALEQSREVDEEAWPSDEAPEAEGEGEEGETAGRGEKKKEKKKKKESRATSKVSQKSTEENFQKLGGVEWALVFPDSNVMNFLQM